MTVKIRHNSAPGQIMLLRELNTEAAKPQPKFTRPHHLGVINRMNIGDSAFLPGYTANARDKARGMKYLTLGSFSRGGERVWTVRGAVVSGVKGIKIFREA